MIDPVELEQELRRSRAKNQQKNLRYIRLSLINSTPAIMHYENVLYFGWENSNTLLKIAVLIDPQGDPADPNNLNIDTLGREIFHSMVNQPMSFRLNMQENTPEAATPEAIKEVDKL